MMKKPSNTSDRNYNITLFEALTPVILLVILLAYNVNGYGDEAMSGSNQFTLLIGAAIATVIGLKKGIEFKSMINVVSLNLKSINFLQSMVFCIFVRQ